MILALWRRLRRDIALRRCGARMPENARYVAAAFGFITPGVAFDLRFRDIAYHDASAAAIRFAISAGDAMPVFDVGHAADTFTPSGGFCGE